MKKIMFDKHLGMQQAVLDGSKNMTRRIVTAPAKFKGVKDTMLRFDRYYDHHYYCWVCDGNAKVLGPLPLPYKRGDIVAIAQSYKDAGWDPMTLQQAYIKKPTIFPELDPMKPLTGWVDLPLKYHKGWNNKMFVHSAMMPHRIHIDDLWFEPIQDISDEDCMREGIKEGDFINTWDRFYYDSWGDVPNHITFKTPRLAFASLIDRISGRGAWDSNPWVAVYTFHLL